jgi:hypothetical protein
LAELYLHERPGEMRAAVVERFRLVEMHIARDGDGLAAGARVEARLKRRLGARGIADLGAEEAVVEPWPAGLAEGAATVVEVTRAAWREPGRERLAKARPTALAPWPAPGLAAALAARGHVLQPGWPDEVAAEWEAGFEAALLGRAGFDGGWLNIVPTPAFTAVDVDGAGLALATPALVALARLIRLWGLGGSIVIDLPPAGDRSLRTAAADAFDKAMGALAFERTAINGFGLMQVVRPRPGPSILERAQLDRDGTDAVALLEQALGETRPGRLTLVARPGVARWLDARGPLLADIARASGRPVDVRRDAMAGSGHVDAG